MPEYTYSPDFYPNGSIWVEQWLKDGEPHREGDKPASVWYREDRSIMRKQWYKDGKRHREDDKPAVIWYRKDDGSIIREHWYKDGVEYTPHTVTCDGKTVEIDGKKYKLTLID